MTAAPLLITILFSQHTSGGSQHTSNKNTKISNIKNHFFQLFVANGNAEIVGNFPVGEPLKILLAAPPRRIESPASSNNSPSGQEQIKAAR